MTRYFFDLHECGSLTEDPEGRERADLDVVRQEALKAARAMMAAEVVEGRLYLSCTIEVRDESGATVLSLPFKDAIAITGI